MKIIHRFVGHSSCDEVQISELDDFGIAYELGQLPAVNNIDKPRLIVFEVSEDHPRKPFLRICGFDASCFLGTRMYELRIFEAQLEGKTDWAVPIEDYPEELWDSFWIAYDCLQIRQDYIVDNYFKYYYIFRSDWIARARQDDLDFVDDFLLTKNV